MAFRSRGKQMIQAQVEVQMPDNIPLDEFVKWFNVEADGIADVVVKDAKASTAFKDKTKRLRKSIKKKIVKGDDGDDVLIVQAREPNAHLVEFGHAMVTGGSLEALYSLKWQDTGKFTKTGKPIRRRMRSEIKQAGKGTVVGHVPAHPFLRPAKEKGIQEAIRRFSK